MLAKGKPAQRSPTPLATDASVSFAVPLSLRGAARPIGERRHAFNEISSMSDQVSRAVDVHVHSLSKDDCRFRPKTLNSRRAPVDGSNARLEGRRAVSKGPVSGALAKECASGWGALATTRHVLAHTSSSGINTE